MQRKRFHHPGEPEKTVIGWTEYVDLPAWGIYNLQAKIDTGARTSALHVEDITVQADGQALFHVILTRKPPYERVAVTAPIVKWARVRSSTGVYTRRCFVRTRLRVGPVVKEIELSLVSREKMLFRMLLGRKALERDFLVDVSRRRTLKKYRRPGDGAGRKEERSL